MGRERFAFKRLVVYQVALDFLGWGMEVSDRLPKSQFDVIDQLRSASLSIVLNIAEGAGAWRPGNKRKHYGYARGSAFEMAAMLDVLRATSVITEQEFDAREEQLAEIGARLTRLCQRYERAVPNAAVRRGGGVRAQAEAAPRREGSPGNEARGKAENVKRLPNTNTTPTTKRRA